MIFYNGFNLLVDILIALIVWRLSYRAGWWSGYGAGEADYIEYGERAGDYFYDQAKESDYEH
jgi:hypothetical protein